MTEYAAPLTPGVGRAPVRPTPGQPACEYADPRLFDADASEAQQVQGALICQRCPLMDACRASVQPGTEGIYGGWLFGARTHRPRPVLGHCRTCRVPLFAWDMRAGRERRYCSHRCAGKARAA